MLHFVFRLREVFSLSSKEIIRLQRDFTALVLLKPVLSGAAKHFLKTSPGKWQPSELYLRQLLGRCCIPRPRVVPGPLGRLPRAFKQHHHGESHLHRVLEHLYNCSFPV